MTVKPATSNVAVSTVSTILHSRSHANPAVIRYLTLQTSRDTACSGIVSPFDRHPSYSNMFERFALRTLNANDSQASNGHVAVSTVSTILHSRSHANPAVIRYLTLQASRDTACSGIVSPFDRHPSYSNIFERFALCTLNVNDSQASNEQRRCKYCFDNLLTTTCSNPTTRSQSIGKACSGAPFHFGMSSYIRTITR